MLRLPAEPADPRLACSDVGEAGGASAHAVAVAIERILQRNEGVVGNGFDETGAEEGNRRPAREDRRRVRHDRLTRVPRHREEVKERLPGVVQRLEAAVGRSPRHPQLGDGAGAAHRRHVVARGAAGAVEGRAEALLGGFHFEEVVEAEAELLELDR